MKRWTTGVLIVLVLLSVASIIVKSRADMTGCVEGGTACCPDDYPDACNDTGRLLGSNQLCHECHTGPGGCMVYACFYEW